MKKCLTVLALTSFLGSSAFATLLTPGSTVVPNSQADPLAGTVVGNTGNQVVSSTTTNLQEWVVTNYAGNPFGTNDLTFVVQLTNVGVTFLDRVTASSFSGVQTDVGYNTSGAGIGTDLPSTADLSPTGGVVGFNFNPQILPVSATVLLIINTNATAFTTGTISDVAASGATGSASGFEPVAPDSTVPEPASYAMYAGGLLALGLLFRRARGM